MSDIAIKVDHLIKIYKLYDKPIDRMKEALSVSRKKYSRDHYALNDISFEVKKGETLGIIGTNGSGKSTLLKIITGVLTQTSGTVMVNGKVSALLELGAGFNPEYTGLENIYLNGTMMGYSKEEIEARVGSIIEFADIGEFINQPVKTYSSGMFVRLAFGIAINVEPDILIIDEALAVGDVKFQLKCFNKIEELRKKDKTIIMVSHDIDSIRRFTDKVLWLHDGRKKMDGDAKEVSGKYMEHLFAESDEDINAFDLLETINEGSLRTPIEHISRWGTMSNLIEGALLNDSSLYEQTLKQGEELNLKIGFSCPLHILKKDNLFVSFGIKNQKGQEVLWGTTKENSIFQRGQGFHIVEFDIKNVLTEGNYSIVVCMEYRDDYSKLKQPEYVDYIDGVFLFQIEEATKKTYSIVNTEYEVRLIDG